MTTTAVCAAAYGLAGEVMMVEAAVMVNGPLLSGMFVVGVGIGADEDMVDIAALILMISIFCIVFIAVDVPMVAVVVLVTAAVAVAFERQSCLPVLLLRRVTAALLG